MLKGVICVCVVKNRNSFFKYIICNYKAKVSSYFNALYETCFGVSGKCFYAFIYTGPNYWPDKCKYRVQNANKQIKQTSFTECAEVLQNILFSLTVGVNKPQAIFFFDNRIYTLHTWGMSGVDRNATDVTKKQLPWWFTRNNRTCRKCANDYRREWGSETERTLVLYRAQDSLPPPPPFKVKAPNFSIHMRYLIDINSGKL